MSYTKQNFLSGQVVTEDNLNHMENGIVAATSVRNWLDNSNFANPVNQRSQSSYNTNQGYCIDRWIFGTESGNGSVVLSSGWISVTDSSNGYCDLWQVLPEEYYLSGKAMTLAAKIVGTEEPLILNFTYGTYAEKYVGSFALIHYKGDRVGLRSYPGDGFASFEWAALYEGTYTADTLPPYVPKGYAEEYAECQRYFVSPVGRFTPVALTSTTNARMKITTPVPMRISPTAKLVNADNIILNNGSSQVLSVTGVSVESMEGTHVYLNLTCSTGPQYASGSTFATNISLSADL